MAGQSKKFVPRERATVTEKGEGRGWAFPFPLPSPFTFTLIKHDPPNPINDHKLAKLTRSSKTSALQGSFFFSIHDFFQIFLSVSFFFCRVLEISQFSVHIPILFNNSIEYER